MDEYASHMEDIKAYTIEKLTEKYQEYYSTDIVQKEARVFTLY